MENIEGVITLEDEKGELVDMHVVEMIEFQNSKYVLLQNSDVSDEESYIFRFSEDIDFDRLESIGDDKELESVIDMFNRKISDSGPVN